MQPIVSVLFTFTLLCASASEGECSGAGDDCTSGFMSVDKMDDLLGNEGDVFVSRGTAQGIFPEVNFTCSGSIQSMVFGAQWLGNSDSFTELQIWRLGSGDGSYTKVGSTTIITEENTTRLYEYRLSSPLAFQAGDVLGFYQPAILSSQLRFLFEGSEEGTREYQLGYYYYNRPSAASQLNVSGPGDTRYTILLNVVTDPPGCGCGFMSVERMRLLLGLDNVGIQTYTDRRQQITPDMRFTCDGMITKWIIGADWNTNEILYPELQVWRNVGNTTYEMINGTLIESPTEDSNRIYEYDNFSSIPVQAGDILGVFIPRTRDSRLNLLSEIRSDPINYYLETGNTVSESPYDMFDIQNTLVRSTGYHPLVSVEIVRNPPSTIQNLLTTTLSVVASVSPSMTVPPPPSPSDDVSPSTTVPPPPSPGDMSPSTAVPPPPSPGDGSSSQGSSVGVGIGAGLAVALVVLIAVLVVVIIVVYVLRKRQSKKAVELTEEKTTDGLDNPVYTGEVTRGPHLAMNELQYHQTGPLEDLYEIPQNDGEETALYDVPAENSVEYAEISRDHVTESTTSPETYKKFDNPLYETH